MSQERLLQMYTVVVKLLSPCFPWKKSIPKFFPSIPCLTFPMMTIRRHPREGPEVRPTLAWEVRPMYRPWEEAANSFWSLSTRRCGDQQSYLHHPSGSKLANMSASR